MRLAPHLHCAVIGDDLVLLDLRTGRYVGVPGGRRRLGISEDRRSLAPADPDVAARLRARGWLAPDEGAAVEAFPIGRAPPPRPTRDLRGLSPPRGRLGDALKLAASTADLGRRYWRKPLAEIVAGARRDPPAPLRADAETLRLAQVFAAASVWIPAPDKCLARSFVLLRFLQRSGRDGLWVFGVQTWPFRAHCWLQVEDVALDDAPESLMIYEPIVAV